MRAGFFLSSFWPLTLGRTEGFNAGAVDFLRLGLRTSRVDISGACLRKVRVRRGWVLAGGGSRLKRRVGIGLL